MQWRRSKPFSRMKENHSQRTAISCRDIAFTHLISTSVMKEQGTVGVFVQEITTPIISRIVEPRQALILHMFWIGSNQMFDLDVREKINSAPINWFALKEEKTSQRSHVVAVFQYLFAGASLQILLEAFQMVCFLDLMTRDLNCFYHACALSHPLSRGHRYEKTKK